ncbi:MAG: hypothetical protein R3Y49_02980 [Rikenellaceae bacterium]
MAAKILQIENTTAQDFIEELRGLITRPDPVQQVVDPKTTYIDRGFIKVNAGLSQRQIEKYEREGVLRRYSQPQDEQKIFYLLCDFIKLKQLLKNC